MKHFNIKDYIDDFKTLPSTLVYSFENLNEQLDTLKSLILECINQQATFVKNKFTNPPVSWMKEFDIADLQKNETTIASWHIILQLKKTGRNLEIYEIN